MQKFTPGQKAKLNIDYASSGGSVATSQILLDGGLPVGVVDVASFLTQFASAAQGALASAAQPGLTYACFEDQKAAGTDGGDFDTAAWRMRTLNTIAFSNITGATLVTNQFNLPAGTYFVYASAPAFRVDSHKARIYDATGSAILVNGSSEYSDASADYAQTSSVAAGFFTLAVASDLQLQHYCNTTRAADGLGVAINHFDLEIYGRVLVVKVA